MLLRSFLLFLLLAAAPLAGPRETLAHPAADSTLSAALERLVTEVDVAVRGDRIVFVGDASSDGVVARDTIDASGLMVTPGFIDMHSHADLEADYGRGGEIFLYQGITTAVIVSFCQSFHSAFSVSSLMYAAGLAAISSAVGAFRS